jgi:hypothetical protein
MKIGQLIENTKIFLRDRKTAYCLTFLNPEFPNAGKLVLKDLNEFCRGDRTAWSDDARHHARLEGRREVLLRIQEHLRLSPDQLFAIYNGQAPPLTGVESK